MVGGAALPSATCASIRRAMTLRRLLTTLTTAVLTLLVLVPTAMAENDGRGFYGSTSDPVVTNVGFILIIFFPTFVFVMSMIQRHLEKRKKAGKVAKKHLSGIDWRGGW
jgi:ABC-type nickel/cobalt efflux system permease component RcnA